MKKTPHTLWATFWEWFWLELKLFFREPVGVFWVVAFPILLLVVFGAMFSRYESPVIRVALVDEDKTEMVLRMRNFLSQQGIFVIREVVSREEMEKAVFHNEVVLGVVIPRGFEMAIVSNGEPVFEVVYNKRQKEMNTIAFSILNSFLYEEVIQRKGVKGKISYVEKEVLGRFESSYVDFVLPGLVALVLISVSFFSVVGKLMGYKEYGVLKQLFLLPVPKSLFIGGEMLSNFLVVVVQVGLLLGMGGLLYHATLPSDVGGWFWFWLYVVVGFVALVVVGLGVVGVVRTYQGAVNVLNIVAYGMMFLGGLYFPLEQMPKPFQWIAAVLPVSYFLDGLRMICEGDSNPAQLVYNLSVMGIFVLVFFPLVMRSVRWSGDSCR